MRIALSALFILIVSSISAQTTITVSTAAELVKAIGPNKTIYLNGGDFDLTTMVGTETDYVKWEDAYDGSQMFITNVNNLKIIGKNNARVLVSPLYTWVMKFYQCQNITLENYTMGHTMGGYCTGGVIHLDSCKNVKVSNCKLFGSGTYGMGVYSCENVTVTNCDIYKCTYGLLQLFYSKNLNFIKNRFRETGEFDLIAITGCNSVNFKTCVFEKNGTNNTDSYEYSSYYFFKIDDSYYDNYDYNNATTTSTNITINTSVFRDNKIYYFTNDYNNLIRIGDNRYERNGFTAPLPTAVKFTTPTIRLEY